MGGGDSVMSHANCGCCCDNSHPLIGPALPTGPLFEWLNATGPLDQGPLAPQNFSGQGFSLPQGEIFLPSIAAEFAARGGSLEFLDFKGHVVAVKTVDSAPGNFAFANSWRQLSLPPEGITVNVQWGPHAASNGGPRATIGGVSKTLTLNGSSLALDGLGMPNGTTYSPDLVLYRTALSETTHLLTVTDEPTDSVPFCGAGLSFQCSDPTAFYYYRTQNGIARESKRIRNTLEGRVVVERDGVVTSDRVRPTEAQHAADTAADGSYVVTKYFDRQYDDPNKLHLWPPRPERLVTSFAKDATVPKYGMLALDDRYADEDLITSTYVFATKPYLRSGSNQLASHADESIPGAAVRPSKTTGVGLNSAFQLRYLPSQSAHTTVGLGGLASNASYRDIFGVSPASLPVLECRVFAVPDSGKGPRPLLNHPVASLREPYRPLTLAERVQQVVLTFSEDIDVSNVTADQVTLLVDGVEADGCTITPEAGSKRRFFIGVPVEPQTAGAFVVLTYDPNGEVVSDTEDQRPAQLAARTSWLMQKPYKQELNVDADVLIFDVGQLASISESRENTASAESLTISLSSAGHIGKHDPGTVSHRPTQDLFAPQMPFNVTGPTGMTGPSDCSYYGMRTTIHPCPPALLPCPMPRLSQPHNSAFRHGRGSNGITVTLSGAAWDGGPSFANEVRIADSLESYGPLEFVTTRNGLAMPQGAWALDVSSDARQLVRTSEFSIVTAVAGVGVETRYLSKRFFDGGTLKGTITAGRSLTQYPQLQTSYGWQLRLRMRLEISHSYSFETQIISGPEVFIPTPGPETRSFVTNEFYAVVSESEELAGTLIRQPFEYEFERWNSVWPNLWTFSGGWPAPGTPNAEGWPLGTVQIDF